MFVLFRIGSWSSAETGLSSMLSAYDELFLVPSFVFLFLFRLVFWSEGVLGRIWNSIVTVPVHCLFICIVCIAY